MLTATVVLLTPVFPKTLQLSTMILPSGVFQEYNTAVGHTSLYASVFFFLLQERKPNCPLTDWSRWSPCSATCGKGRRMRTRLQVAYNEETKKMYERMKEGYNGPLNMEDCLDAQVIDEVECEGEIPSCAISTSMAKG